jgi:hypothetical protein
MTALFSYLTPKEMPLVCRHENQARSTESFTMDRPGLSCKTKGSLGEQEISDLISDELFEVPSGSHNDTDSECDLGKTVNLSPVIQSESDSESSSKESVGTDTWGTVDKPLI